MDQITDLTPLGAITAAGSDPLRDALLDSRQRWRDLVAMGADLAFETDAAGRLVFISPDPALGWPSAALIGQPAEMLLASGAGGSGSFNPFRPDEATRHRRAWCRQADGQLACLTFASAPLLGPGGQAVGARGIGVDTTDQNARDNAVTAALRRGEVIEHILCQMRQEVLAPRMMQAVMGAVVRAVGAEGAAVLDLLQTDPAGSVLHQVGTPPDPVLPAAAALLQAESDAPSAGHAAGGQPVLACQTFTRFGERAGLALWRAPGGREWDREDLQLASSVTGIVRIVLEHESIQREMGRQAKTDPLTGLLNRRAFLDEMARRIDRLDREELPGTLVFVDLDNFKPLNDRFGHDIGDEALVRTGTLLRDTVRPADLVARLGGDEFAMWLDGSDELTAAERADSLRVNAPRELAAILPDGGLTLTMSIGIACRRARSGEDIDELFRRADQAMYEVKRAGRGHWRVSQPEAVP